MSELRVNSIRATTAGTPAINFNSDGTIDVPVGLTVAGAEVGGGGLDIGTSAERPTPATNEVRWNTDTAVLETYFPYNNNQSTPGWVAVGGRQLLARTLRNDAWSSVDILWGGAGGRNHKYYGYEIELAFFEPGDASDRNYLARWIDGNGAVDTGTRYFWAHEWIHANDGISRTVSGTGGTTFFPISTDNNTSYNLTSNGESNYRCSIKMSNTPNNSTTERWAWTLHSAGETEQAAGYLVGGGRWNCPTRVNSNAYPCNGIRVYLSGGTMRATTGVNFIASVYGLSGYEHEDLGYANVG